MLTSLKGFQGLLLAAGGQEILLHRRWLEPRLGREVKAHHMLAADVGRSCLELLPSRSQISRSLLLGQFSRGELGV